MQRLFLPLITTITSAQLLASDYPEGMGMTINLEQEEKLVVKMSRREQQQWNQLTKVHMRCINEDMVEMISEINEDKSAWAKIGLSLVDHF